MNRAYPYDSHGDEAFLDAIAWEHTGNMLTGTLDGLTARHVIDDVGGITTAKANVALQIWRLMHSQAPAAA